MTAFALEFLCPHCGQRLQSEAGQAGAEVNCPACQGRIALPGPADDADPIPPPSSPVVPRCDSPDLGEQGPPSGFRLSAVLGGLACGYLGYRTASIAIEVGLERPAGPIALAVGAALGAVFGWRLGSTRTPSAPSCFTLAAAAWGLMVLLWGWVLTRPAGAFHDQGGMLITFLVLPLTLLSWLVGGPVALALAFRARRRLERGEGEDIDQRLTRAGVLLSRLMLWGGAALFAVELWREFSR